MNRCPKFCGSSNGRNFIADFIHCRGLYQIWINIGYLNVLHNPVAVDILCHNRIIAIFFCYKTATRNICCFCPYCTVRGFFSGCPFHLCNAGTVICLYFNFYRLICVIHKRRRYYEHGFYRICLPHFSRFNKLCQIISKCLIRAK